MEIKGYQDSFKDDDQIASVLSFQSDKLSEGTIQQINHLQFSIDSIQPYFQFPSSNSLNTQDQPLVIPVMLTCSQPDFFPKEKEIEKCLKTRDSIDLIIIVDRSGSMNEENKLNLLKATLIQVIDLLKETDRVCLIQFNEKAERLCHLMLLSDTNQQMLIHAINSLTAEGETSIAHGMNLGLKQLQERRFKNPVTRIFLLSDGIDTSGNANKIIEKLLNTQYKDLEQDFVVNSFGYGRMNNWILLDDLSTKFQGNYYFIEDVRQIDLCFADALGAAFSVMAKNLKISFNLSQTLDPNLIKKISLKYSYGYNWTQTSPVSYEINVNHLNIGQNKYFLFDIELIKGDNPFQHPVLEPIELLSATCNYERTKYKDQVFTENTSLRLHYFNECYLISDEFTKKNREVEVTYLKTKSAHLVKVVLQLIKENKGENAKILLVDHLKSLQELDGVTKGELGELMQELRSAEQLLNQKQSSYKIESTLTQSYKQQIYSTTCGANQMNANRVQLSLRTSTKQKAQDEFGV